MLSPAGEKLSFITTAAFPVQHLDYDLDWQTYTIRQPHSGTWHQDIFHVNRYVNWINTFLTFSYTQLSSAPILYKLTWWRLLVAFQIQSLNRYSQIDAQKFNLTIIRPARVTLLCTMADHRTIDNGGDTLHHHECCHRCPLLLCRN